MDPLNFPQDAGIKRAGSFDAVMLDLDGTLVDTLADLVEALARVLKELQLPPLASAAAAALVGKGGAYLVRGALLASGLEPARVAGLAEGALRRYQFHYGEVNGRQAKVYPGVVEGLQRLRAQGLRLACVTNKPTPDARALLRAMSLEGFFALVAGGEQFERIKPDPEPLLKTCEALGTVPGRTLMVGDSLNDALAARAAGCPVVLVTYGFNHGQPVRSVDADGYVDSIASLALA